MAVRRHPILGLLGGALVGLGLGLLMITLGAAPLGAATILILLGAGAVLGVIYAMLVPAPSRPPAVRRPVHPDEPPAG